MQEIPQPTSPHGKNQCSFLLYLLKHLYGKDFPSNFITALFLIPMPPLILFIIMISANVPGNPLQNPVLPRSLENILELN